MEALLQVQREAKKKKSTTRSIPSSAYGHGPHRVGSKTQWNRSRPQGVSVHTYIIPSDGLRCTLVAVLFSSPELQNDVHPEPWIQLPPQPLPLAYCPVLKSVTKITGCCQTVGNFRARTDLTGRRRRAANHDHDDHKNQEQEQATRACMIAW
jgi:hypothetical protein